MTELSPQAQAARRDLAQIMQELSKYCRVSISATDVLPITLETNDASLEAGINALCAAALRAAAHQVVPEENVDEADYDCLHAKWAAEGKQEARRDLLAIAAELEGAQAEPPRRQVFPTPHQIAECGGPCEQGGPEACDCGLYCPCKSPH